MNLKEYNTAQRIYIKDLGVEKYFNCKVYCNHTLAEIISKYRGKSKEKFEFQTKLLIKYLINHKRFS